MASYKEVNHPNHKDVQNYVFDEGRTADTTSPEQWATGDHAVWTTGRASIQSSTLQHAVPTPATSPGAISDCSKSIVPVTKTEAMFAPTSSEPTGRTKIIIGTVSAAAIITFLAALSLCWAYKRRNRRRRARSSTLTPPHSPLLAQHSDEKKADKKITGEIAWVKIGFAQVMGGSPRASFDSGLGVMVGDKAEVATSAAGAGAGACRTNMQQHNVFESPIVHQSDLHERSPGGPLSSNPPVVSAFGHKSPPPSNQPSKPRSQSTGAREITIAETIEGISQTPAMPVMGDGALTAKSSRESINTVIAQMEPTTPKHRQLSPVKSILKKRSPSPPPMMDLPPVAFIEPEAAEEPKMSKVSSIRKAMGSLVKPKKELKIVIAIEQPVDKPKKKRVSFGEDVVRRVSHSPETDEGDWTTIDTSSDDAGEHGEDVALERS